MADGIHKQVLSLQKKIKKLKESAQRRIVKKSVSKGLAIIRKGIRDAVPSKYKDAKRAIGSSFTKPKQNSGDTVAKVGSGVGIKFKKIRKDAAKRKESKRKKTGGVGISAANLHWFILGTDERTTGVRSIRRRDGTRYTKETGNTISNRGRMPAVLAGVVDRGFKTTASRAAEVIAETGKLEIIKEAERLAKKK